MPRRSAAAAALTLAALLTLIASAATTAHGQAVSIQPRHELGRRVRAFEADLAPILNDDQARARSAPHLNRAVRSFFALALPESGRAIDDARAALRDAKPPDAASAWASSLALAPASRFLDAAATSITVQVAPFYRARSPIPDNASIRLTLADPDPDPSRVFGVAESKITELPATLTIPLMNLAEGDHTLTASVQIDGREAASQTQRISAVARRDARLAAARRAIDAWPATDPTTTLKASARFLLDQLSRLADGATLELDVPAAARLAELEAMIEAEAAGRPFLGPDRPGDFWIALTTSDARAPVPARLLVPDGINADEPRPLVVALHGAGGSENLFFESYGHGAIVDECRRRGWLLVAPRGMLAPKDLPSLLDAIARLLPIDRRRVALVGHSMGAAQAVAAASAAPDQFAALVALGGGGRVVPSERLRALPAFVAVGRDDFALEAARGLTRSLKTAGLTEIQQREYANVEHLAIVQVALPEVFAWLDARWRDRPSP
jgi:pimeloyl-ACP methyl ester carboxylesterase